MLTYVHVQLYGDQTDNNQFLAKAIKWPYIPKKKKATLRDVLIKLGPAQIINILCTSYIVVIALYTI